MSQGQSEYSIGLRPGPQPKPTGPLRIYRTSPPTSPRAATSEVATGRQSPRAVERALSPREREDLALVKRLQSEGPGTSSQASFQSAQLPGPLNWSDPTMTDVDAWIAEAEAARAAPVVVRRAGPPGMRTPPPARTLPPAVVARPAGSLVRRVAIRPLSATLAKNEETARQATLIRRPVVVPVRTPAQRAVITPSQSYEQEEAFAEQKGPTPPDLSRFDWRDLARYNMDDLRTAADALGLPVRAGMTREDLEAELINYALGAGLLDGEGEEKEGKEEKRPAAIPGRVVSFGGVGRPPGSRLYVPGAGVMGLPEMKREETKGDVKSVPGAIVRSTSPRVVPPGTISRAVAPRRVIRISAQPRPTVPLDLGALFELPLEELRQLAIEYRVRPAAETREAYIEALSQFA